MTHKQQDVAIILLAAGTGNRFKKSSPLSTELAKQYWELEGQAVVKHAAQSLLPFSDHVLPVGDVETLSSVLNGCGTLPPIPGGKERQDSVRAGLEYINQHIPNIKRVLIHDSARPFPSEDMILRVLKALEKSEGCVPVLPVTDTIKKSSSGFVEETVPRNVLWRAQTPQGFHFPLLLDLHRKATEAATDDAVLLEQNQFPVALVEGSTDAIKLTEYSDLAILRIIAQQKKDTL